MPEFTRLINDVGYTYGSRSTFSQALWWNESALDWTRYAGWFIWVMSLGFASWTPNVHVAGQRKNSRTSSRSNPTVLGNRTSANYTASNPKSQTSTSSALGYQPPTPSHTAAFSSPFSVPPAVKALLNPDETWFLISAPRSSYRSRKAISKTARCMQLLRHWYPGHRLRHTYSTRCRSSRTIFPAKIHGMSLLPTLASPSEESPKKKIPVLKTVSIVRIELPVYPNLLH